MTRLLASSSLLKGLKRPDLQAVCAVAHHRAVDPHGVFFRQGEPATHIYVLLAGELKLTQLHPDGQEVIPRMIWPGEVFGGIAAWGDTTYPVSAEAIRARPSRGRGLS